MTTFVEVLEVLGEIAADLQILALFAVIVFLPALIHRLLLEWRRNNWRFRTTHLLVAMFVISVLLGMYHYINR
jgi:hypothetical protein